MKTIRKLILAGFTLASLYGATSALAQTSVGGSSPTNSGTGTGTAVAPASGTSGVPDKLKPLIASFEKTRDKYLKEQDLLLIKLSNATTPGERAQIRAALQANRAAFQLELKASQEQLKNQLTALKGKISHEEFLRIIDAAYNAATEGGLDHHKGH
jgi:hypothetical protein